MQHYKPSPNKQIYLLGIRLVFQLMREKRKRFENVSHKLSQTEKRLKIHREDSPHIGGQTTIGAFADDGVSQWFRNCSHRKWVLISSRWEKKKEQTQPTLHIQCTILHTPTSSDKYEQEMRHETRNEARNEKWVAKREMRHTLKTEKWKLKTEKTVQDIPMHSATSRSHFENWKTVQDFYTKKSSGFLGSWVPGAKKQKQKHKHTQRTII